MPHPCALRRVNEKPLPRDPLFVAMAQSAGHGRILLRPSGTEPLLRVMVKGRDAMQVSGVAE